MPSLNASGSQGGEIFSEFAAGADETKDELPVNDDEFSRQLSNSIEPPPDGGLAAWSQAVMGHLVLINSWGYLTSFGLFESYYTASLHATPSAISWIGSVQIFLVYFVGTFSGRALDAGYYHAVLISGSVLQVLAIFTTSIATEYWQLFLSQGICKGLGDGLVFCPTVSLVATYFTSKRAVAMALTASGGATGGIIFPLIAQQILPKVGFAWTVRTMGFVVFFNAIIAVSVARVRLTPRRGPLVEWSAFREMPYTFYCIGMFLNLWAVYFAYFYVSLLCSIQLFCSAWLTIKVDHSLCQRYNQSLHLNLIDNSSSNQRRRPARSTDLRTHSRSSRCN